MGPKIADREFQMSSPGNSYISSIVIEQQARELRAQVVRQAAIRAHNAVRVALDSVRESIARARVARGSAQWFGAQ